MNLETREGKARAFLIALRAAEEAASILMRGFRTRLNVEKKGRVDLVTEYDLKSENLLRETLTRRTEFAFVGEEQGRSNHGNTEATWVVDPLDGTTNYVHGHPFFAVSVGLVFRGELILGVVAAPALETTWGGIVGDGATRNNSACRVSDVKTLSDAMLATGFPYDRATSPANNFEAFVAVEKRAQAVRRCGSAAIDLALVADGTYDGYWERKLHPWDWAAGCAIVVAAGGRLSSIDTEKPQLDQGSVVATNGLIHEELIDAVRSV